jgi:hypothetical protein
MGSRPESPGERDKDRDGGLAHPRVGPWAYSRASDIVQADPVLVLDYEKSHGKAMEQISVSMATVVQDFPSYKQDFQKLQFQMQKQDGRLGHMEKHFPCLFSQTVLPGSNAKDLALVESTSAEQDD